MWSWPYKAGCSGLRGAERYDEMTRSPAIVLVRGEPKPRLLAKSDAPSGVTTTSAALLQEGTSPPSMGRWARYGAASPAHTGSDGSTTRWPDRTVLSSPVLPIAYVVSALLISCRT